MYILHNLKTGPAGLPAAGCAVAKAPARRAKGPPLSGLSLYMQKHEAIYGFVSLRVGITTSKKVGNAVKRSRSRRVIREAFRMCALRVKPGYDFVFVARGKTPFVKSTDLFKSMEKQLRDAGVLQ